MAYVTVKDVQEKLFLELSAGEVGMERQIHTSDISRPGLEMAGYFNYYLADRVQLLGKTELSFFANLTEAERIGSNDKTLFTKHASYYCGT